MTVERAGAAFPLLRWSGARPLLAEPSTLNGFGRFARVPEALVVKYNQSAKLEAQPKLSP
jgi:hypothetical protein